MKRDELCPRCKAEVPRGKHKEPLAENQILDSGGRVHELRWHNGEQEHRVVGIFHWEKWPRGPSSGWAENVDTWFRKYCPPDRFVTDGGEVLEFRMRDDGEAQSSAGHVTASSIPPDTGPCGHAMKDALYRFRDQERAKWRVYWDTTPKENGTPEGKPFAGVLIEHEGERDGWWYQGGEMCDALLLLPTWVRRKVEALYREHNQEPEWTFEFDGGFGKIVLIRKDGTTVATFAGKSVSDPSLPARVIRDAQALYREHVPEWRTEWNGFQVAVLRNGECFGYFDKRCATPNDGRDWPPHILAEARAKFRANYQLKDNEIWFQGMPVGMEWDESQVTFQASACTLGQWDEEETRETWLSGLIWTDESERLEAHDKMRRYYYEMHPGKALHPYCDRPLVFTMDGACFEERDNGEGPLVDATIGPLHGAPLWNPVITKLRAWTSAQLAKRPVTFDAYVVEYKYVANPERSTSVSHTLKFSGGADHAYDVCEKVDRAFKKFRHARVTIEPLGDE